MPNATTDLVRADEEAKVAEIQQAIASVVMVANAIEVTSHEQAQDATSFLTKIAAERRQSEEARKFLTGPLNEHVKAINARFKSISKPLDEADEIVRGKVLAFRQAEDARRREAEARLEAERQERERQAEAERRRLAEEADRLRRDAEAREAERQAQLAAAADTRRREIAAMTDDELRQLAVDGVVDDGSPAALDAAVAEQELRARRAAREAQAAAAKAEQAREEAMQAEIAAKSAFPVALAPVTRLHGRGGSIAERKVWKAEVVDEALVPREYLTIDQRKINAAVKAGTRDIPGVRIHQVDELAVRAAR